MLRDSGFFDTQTEYINGCEIAPLDMTLKVLAQAWKRPEESPDFAYLKVVSEGVVDGERKLMTTSLFDRYNPKTNETARARTTGFPCSFMAQAILEGAYKDPGLVALEYIGSNHPELSATLQLHLRNKGIVIKGHVEDLDVE